MNFQPLTIGQILDNTFRSYRENFASLFSYTLLYQGIFILIISLYPLLLQANNSFLFWLILILLYLLYAFIIIPVFYGGVVHDTLHQLQHEEALSFQQLLKLFPSLRKMFVSTNALMILIVTIFVFVFGLIMAVIVFMTASAFTLGVAEQGIIVFVISIVITLLMLVFLLWVPLLFPAVEIEKLRNFSAIKYVMKITYRKFGRVLAVLILLAFIYTVIYMGLLALTSAGMYLFQSGGFDWEALTTSVWFVIFYSLISVLLAPLFPILCTWLYLDVRARVEGGDLVLALETNGEEDNEFNS